MNEAIYTLAIDKLAKKYDGLLEYINLIMIKDFDMNKDEAKIISEKLLDLVAKTYEKSLSRKFISTNMH